MGTRFGGGSHRQQRHDQQRHDVDDFDQRVHGRAGGVLVGVAHGVTGNGRLVRIAALLVQHAVAVGEAFFDQLLRVVPGAAACAHADGHEETGDDGAHQQATQRGRPEQHADRDRRHDRQQTRNDHLLDGCRGEHVHRRAVIGLALVGHDLAVGKLFAHLDDHRAGSAAHGLHGHRAEQEGDEAADEQAHDDVVVAQIENQAHAARFQRVGVVGKQHQRGQTG